MLIGFGIFSALCILVSFSSHSILSGFIAIVMTALFAVSYLMGIQIIPEKKPHLRQLAAVAAFVLLIPYFSLYSPDYSSLDLYEQEEFEQSDIMLGYMLPAFPSDKGVIHHDSTTELSLDFHGISKKQYTDYISACKEMGFIIDADRTSSSYDATNVDSYKLHISYFDSMEELSIQLNTASEEETTTVPTPTTVQKSSTSTEEGLTSTTERITTEKSQTSTTQKVTTTKKATTTSAKNKQTHPGCA